MSSSAYKKLCSKIVSKIVKPYRIHLFKNVGLVLYASINNLIEPQNTWIKSDMIDYKQLINISQMQNKPKSICLAWLRRINEKRVVHLIINRQNITNRLDLIWLHFKENRLLSKRSVW